jgi:cytochrome c-type biogenesis protein CcmH/NrfG
MPELLLLALGLVAAGVVVLAPLRRAQPARDAAVELEDARQTALLRHRVALEALRDVEADHRSGTLTGDASRSALADAEAHAAATRAAVDAAPELEPPPSDPRGPRRGAIAAAVIGGVLLVGAAIPASGVANSTIVNQALADAQAAETARQTRISELLDALRDDPSDPAALSDLADAYLEGTGQEDLVRAAVALRLLIELEPDRADAYERIVAAYLRAGDYVNARAALDAYAERDTADPVEVAFLDGLIALRGENDPEAALKAFDRFLELAPDDPRAGMIRSLREEAAGSVGS